MFKLNNYPIILKLILLTIVGQNLTYCAARIQNEQRATKQDLQLIKAAENGNKEKVKELIEQGANVNATNKHGSTALMQASIHGHKEIVELLLNAGSDVNAANEYGDTALILAAVSGHKEIIELLLNEEADVNAVDSRGGTALMWAAENGHKEAVKLLLNEGADVNAVDNYGQTALIRGIRLYGIDARTNERKEIVGLLLRAGANVDHRDIGGKGVIDLIQERDELEVTKMMGNPGREDRHELVKILEDEPSRREAAIKKFIENNQKWIKENLTQEISKATSGQLIPDLSQLIAQYAIEYMDLPLVYRLNN